MNHTSRYRIALIALLSISAIACKPADPAATASTTPGAAKLSGDDLGFFAKAAQGDMSQIAAAEMAASRSTRAEIKRYAEQITTDHRQSTAALSTLATRKGVSLPTSLDADQQKLLDELRTADDFDDRYLDAMEDGHEKAVSLFDDTAKDSKDAEVRAYAASSLPTLKAHLDMAKALDDTEAAPSEKP